MASSVPYVKAQEPHHLEKYMPEILKAYMESRLSSVEVIIRFDFVHCSVLTIYLVSCIL